MKTIPIELVALLSFLTFCHGQDLFPDFGDQDLNILGLYSITPAGTASVPTYVLPETSSNARTPTSSNNPLLIPGAALPRTYPKYALSNNFATPSINNQLPVAYPQMFGMTPPQVLSPCQVLMQILSSQNQFGPYLSQPALVSTSYKK